MENSTENNQKLYEEAEGRVQFKQHAKTYVVINLLIWGVWFFTRGMYGHYDGFWPIFPTVGWGFGLFSHYRGAYQNNHSAIEKEMEKIKRERNQ